jgi:dipeptidase
VANWAYSRYSDMVVDIQKVQWELESGFLAEQPEIERTALALLQTSPLAARDYLTAYSVKQGEMVVGRWRKLGEFLLWKYLDGNVRDTQGNVLHPKYPESWYRAIASDHGEAVKAREVKPRPVPAAAPAAPR